MTLADLLASPLPPLAELRGLWLVIPADVAATLLAKQESHGDPRHRVAPIHGPDLASVALCADLLTEVAPGGLHAATFAALDSGRFADVEVATFAALEAAGWFAPGAEPQP